MIPVTTPLVAPTTAMPGVSLDQVPPVVVLLHVCEKPTHIGVVPVIDWAIGAVIVTVLVAVLTHPPEVVTVYVMVDVPADTPVTKPVVEPAVATAVAELDQVPPVVVLVHVWEEPTQIGVVPVMFWATGVVMVTAALPCAPQHPAAERALK